MIYNVYCDESCHLENDGHPIMILGAVWCPAERSNEIFRRIRDIKMRHGLKSYTELKWTKVSPNKVQMYLDVVDYFFDDDDLHFRGLIVSDKQALRHEDYDQNHDTWYYKMYFNLLKTILKNSDQFRIYLDIKDTRSQSKIAKLHEILSSSKYDFQNQIVERIQSVRSHEIELVQMTDILIGALSYVNRGLSSSHAKIAVVDRMRKRSRLDLTRSTFLGETKVNLFRWTPKG